MFHSLLLHRLEPISSNHDQHLNLSSKVDLIFFQQQSIFFQILAICSYIDEFPSEVFNFHLLNFYIFIYSCLIQLIHFIIDFLHFNFLG